MKSQTEETIIEEVGHKSEALGREAESSKKKNDWIMMTMTMIALMIEFPKTSDWKSELWKNWEN